MLESVSRIFWEVGKTAEYELAQTRTEIQSRLKGASIEEGVILDWPDRAADTALSRTVFRLHFKYTRPDTFEPILRGTIEKFGNGSKVTIRSELDSLGMWIMFCWFIGVMAFGVVGLISYFRQGAGGVDNLILVLPLAILLFGIFHVRISKRRARSKLEKLFGILDHCFSGICPQPPQAI